MKKIYIAGPLTPLNSSSPIEYLNNCNQMTLTARHLLREGFAVYCPATDLLLFFGSSLPIDQEMVYKNSLAWLSVSDAVLLLRNWERSKGCQEEVALANRLNIPVFLSIPGLLKAINPD